MVEDEVENWDDEDLDISGDDFTFRSASIATTNTNALSHHRDSISSRLSFRSDFDSNHGDDERQLHLPGDDERSTNDAIAAAKRAGIPLPENVPSSALMGGTIKRLGGRKVKKAIHDDWDEDLELPDIMEGGLKIKNQDGANFPDQLRQVSGPSSTLQSPVKAFPGAPVFSLNAKIGVKPSNNMQSQSNLDKFMEDENDDDFFGDAGASLKIAKSRPAHKPMQLITPPTPKKTEGVNDDFEQDFQLPSDGGPLRLSAHRDIPMTPVSAQDEFDEWGEGSLGTRFGGTRRDGRSNRSSSASALSPSVSSSMTVESEDEGLEGLVLPPGPLHFNDILKKRQLNQSPDQGVVTRAVAKEDFLSGLEIGDGDVFNSSKLTLNRNIKVKSTRPISPIRPKTAVSLTFTNKPVINSRLPRPQHERALSNLEPVSESGGPISTHFRRSQSRLGGHSAHSSLSSIPTPTTPSSANSATPNTPRRREAISNPPANAIRNEPTTTNSQLLKLKRSMPAMRANQQSPARPLSSRYDRPPSRTDGHRPLSMSRPKTPVDRDRSGADSSLSYARKKPQPFLPAGASGSQSHHITNKTSRHFRRNDSESSNELRPVSRATTSRSNMRSPSPLRTRTNLRNADTLAKEAASKRQMTKPVRKRHFGDGCELDGFDDLPTSAGIEQKFTKQPIARGAPKSILRNKLTQSALPERVTTPVPTTPFSPRDENLPRFARDTNASRMAREQVLAQRAPSSAGAAPLATLTNNWKSQINAKTGLNPFHGPSLRTKKFRSVPQLKPHLIKPMGDTLSNPKCEFRYSPPNRFRPNLPHSGERHDIQPYHLPLGRQRSRLNSIRLSSCHYAFHSHPAEPLPRKGKLDSTSRSHNQHQCQPRCPSRRRHGVRSPTYVLAQSRRLIPRVAS